MKANPNTERFKLMWKEKDDKDKEMVKKCSEVFKTKEEQHAFIEGYHLSRMQPSFKVIYEVAMYVLDYFPQYKGDFHYQANQIYEIFRELHPTNEYVQSLSWNSEKIN